MALAEFGYRSQFPDENRTANVLFDVAADALQLPIAQPTALTGWPNIERLRHRLQKEVVKLRATECRERHALSRPFNADVC